MTKELIEKLGGKVKNVCKKLMLGKFIATNYSFIEKECKQIE